MKTVLAQRLRAARTAIFPEVTQRAVAKQLDVSPSAVNLWEAGKTEPSATDLAQLSRMYGVTTDWLLGAIESDQKIAVRSGNAPPIFTVPVVPPSALRRWQLTIQTELLQTSVLYPAGTAAGLLVSSDALTSSCPTGAYAVVSKGHPVSPGNIVLASINSVADPVLRKFVREGGDDLLIADDSRYPTYRLSDSATIIGRVTEVTVRKSL